jgi:hypothetical protein
MTNEQKIRAKALLIAVTWAKGLSSSEMLKYARMFEDYINGENNEG